MRVPSLAFAALLLVSSAWWSSTVAWAEDSVADLVELLASDDSPSRVRALNELRNRNDPKAISLIVDRMPSMGESSQYYGILVLDQFDDKQLRGPLRSLLKCESAYIRVCAAEMLHKRGTKGMPRVIAEELSAPELPRDQWRRMMVRLRYGRLPQDDRLIDALLEPLVPAGDADVIRETAYVLDDIDALAAIPAFEALVGDDRPGVRAVAAGYLRARGENRDGDLAAAIRTGQVTSQDMYFVREVLTDLDATPPGPHVVDALLAATAVESGTTDLRAVIQLLEKLGDMRALPRMRELSRHENTSVAKAAADAVAALSGTKPAIGSSPVNATAADTTALTKMLTARDRDGLVAWLEDEDATRRLSAAEALRRMDDHGGLPKVLAEVTCENAVHRRSAVKILGDFRVRVGVEPLIEATLDEDSTVRSYARTGLRYTLETLFPQRRFGLTSRGGADTEANRTSDAELLRAWWREADRADW